MKTWIALSVFAVSAVAAVGAIVPVDSIVNTFPDGAYYDLGYKLTSDMSVELKFSYDSANGTEILGLFGSRTSANEKNISINMSFKTKEVAADFNNSAYADYRALAGSIAAGVIYTVSLDKSGTSISANGSQVAKAKSGWYGNAAFTTPGNAYLFRIYGATGWSLPKTSAAIRFYGCTVKSASGAVIHNYVPALNDGVPCIYDLTTASVLSKKGGNASLSCDAASCDSFLDYARMTSGMTVNLGMALTAGHSVERTFRALDENGIGKLTTETVAGDQFAWTDQQLYSLKVFAGETLLRHVVPAVKGGQVKLFDRVTRAFMSVADGTLTTDCGVPYDKQMSSVHASNSEFDLGYPLSSDMTVVYQFSLPYTLKGTTYGLFGARGSGANTQNISINISKGDGDYTVNADFNNAGSVSGDTYANYRATQTLSKDKTYTVTLSKDGVTVNDGSTTVVGPQAWTGAAFTTPGNARLFKANGATFWYADVQFRQCLVYDGTGKLIHHYVPVAKASLGLIYDRIEGVTLTDLASDGKLVGGAQTYLDCSVEKNAAGYATTVRVSDKDGKAYAYGVYVVADTEDRGEGTTNGWAFVNRVGQVPAHLGANTWTFDVPERVLRKYPTLRVVTIPEFDATSYARDGLMAQWDVQANAAGGYGASNKLKDLVGKADFVNANWMFGADAVYIPGGNETTANLPTGRLPITETKSAEVVSCVNTNSWSFSNGKYGISLCVCNDLVLFYKGTDYPAVARFTHRDADDGLTGYFYYNKSAGTVADVCVPHNYSLTSTSAVEGSSFWRDGELCLKVGASLSTDRVHTSATTHADTVRIGAPAEKGAEYFYTARVYDRELTREERAYNAKIDSIRYQGVQPWIKSSGAYTTRVRVGLSLLIR